MRVAFYAPLKSPDHPVPSGDRQLARALLQALRAAGHEATVASRFRSFDAGGDALRQERLKVLGGHLAQRLIAHYRRHGAAPDVWFTYHLYHKAPDWLGAPVSRALGIPYVVAEASVAAKQRHGPWAVGFAGSVDAVKAAAAVVMINPADVAGVRSVRPSGAEVLLPAFIDLEAFAGPPLMQPATSTPALNGLRLVTVAMMRPGAKLASYRVLAAALARIERPAWSLVIVGDGPARGDVEAAFSGFDRDRVRFAGALPAPEVAALLRRSDVFVWPAVDEAFGMALIEAQACGLPVVAGDTGGVGAIVANGWSGLLVPVGDATAFAAAVERLLVDVDLRTRLGRQAVEYVRSRHDLPVAAAQIDALLQRLVAARASPASP